MRNPSPDVLAACCMLLSSACPDICEDDLTTMIRRKNEQEATTRPPDREETFVTTAEVSELLHCCTATLRNWEKEGKLDAIRIGRRKLYRRSSILRLMQGVS